jgi:hypothetical protein
LNYRAMRTANTAPDGLLSETNDMTIVKFPCHPGESIEGSEHWMGKIHCPVCGNYVSV